MTPDWARLGHAFAEARRAENLTQTDVADRISVSRTPIQAIERGHASGKPFLKVTGTMRAYARLLGWTDASIDQVLAGGDPEKVAPPPPPSAPEPPSDLPPAIALELRSGQTIDSTVVHLGPEDSDARIIVVLKGESDMTDEQLEDAWRRWRKSRRHLQGITSDPESSPDS